MSFSNDWLITMKKINNNSGMDFSYSVLIPSAILIPESLRTVGDLPAIVYPLSDGTVFDALYNQYRDASEILIVLGEGASEAHSKLDSKMPNNVRLIDMSTIDDLAATVKFGLEHLSDQQSPVIINFSDTVATGPILNKENSFYSSSERFSDEWTFFDYGNKGLRITHDRIQSALLEKKRGEAFVGVFRFDDPALLINEFMNVRDVVDGEVSRFYLAVEQYSKQCDLCPVNVDDWLDIGHPAGYVAAQLQVKAREFNHIEIDQDRAILRKSSDDVDKFLGEIRWYLKLPSDVSYSAPRIFSYSLDYRDPWVEMEYYPYHTLNSLWLNGDLDRVSWARIFDKIGLLLDDFSRYRVDDSLPKVEAALRDMYLVKTIDRLEKLRGNTFFSRLFTINFTINGKEYPSLEVIETLLESIVPNRLCKNGANICLIHGDLCFANVMVDQSYSFIKTVDPRGKFGPYDIYGDQRYELAKLAHSVDGKYDLIIKDRFNVSYDNEGAIEFAADVPQGPDLYELLKECLAVQIGDHLDEIELIESLLFLSMVPLHSESLDHQVAMLATGLQLLDRSIDFSIEKLL